MKPLNLTHTSVRGTLPGALRTGFTVLATGLALMAVPNCASTKKLSAQDETKFIDAALSGRNNANAKNRNGETALMIASSRGHTETVRLLLGYEADVDATDERGETALMGAAANGRTETVSLLLEYGADMTVKDKDGWTAQDFAKDSATAAILRAKKAK
jgi:ankyrin repeat protein